MLFKERLVQQLPHMERAELQEVIITLLNEHNELISGLAAFPGAVFIVNKEAFIHFTNHFGRKFLNIEGRYYGRSLLKTLRSPEITQCITRLLHQDENSYRYTDLSFFSRTPKDFLIGVFPIRPPTPVARATTKKSPPTSPPAHYLIIIQDISTFKQRYIEESQESSIASLTLLTSGIAHEIKNPLSALDLHLQLIGRTIERSNYPEKKELEELFSIVNHEVKRLDSIINDFLQSFRPRKAIRKPMNLNNIVKLTLNLLKAKLKEKNVNLTVKLSPQLQPFPFDKNLIEQLLLNIIENSIEAIEEKKSDDPPVISITTHETLNTLTLTLKDNGIGIKEVELAKIFQPFYTSKKMGTGLGLSIVSRIMHEHNGEIIIESHENSGTHVMLEFHRHPRKVPMLEKHAPHPPTSAVSS